MTIIYLIKCPKCSSTEVMDVLEVYERLSNSGLFSPDTPPVFNYHCNECGHGWTRDEEIDDGVEFIDGGRVQEISCTLNGKLRLKMSDSPKDTLYLSPREILKVLNDYDLIKRKSRVVRLQLKEGEYYE